MKEQNEKKLKIKKQLAMVARLAKVSKNVKVQ